MFDFVSLPSVHLVIYCVSLHRNYVWIWFFVFVSVHFLKIFYLKWWKCVNSVDTVYTEKHQLLEIDIQKEWNWNYLLKRHLLIIFSQFICSFVAFLCFFLYFYSTWRTFVHHTQYIVYTLRQESEREDRNWIMFVYKVQSRCVNILTYIVL